MFPPPPARCVIAAPTSTRLTAVVVLGVLALLLIPALAAADSAPSGSSTAAPGASPAGGFGAYDAMGYAVFAAFIIFAGWIIWWFYQKAQAAVGGGGAFDSIEETVFEREVIRGIGTSSTAAAAGASLPSPAKIPVPSGAPPSSAADAAPATDGDSADLGRRLQTLGIFDVVEGSLPLPMPPDGTIWRLKNGTSALVLPRMESEAAMAYFAKRFDFVIAPTPTGEALVVRRLEGQVADWTRG